MKFKTVEFSSEEDEDMYVHRPMLRRHKADKVRKYRKVVDSDSLDHSSPPRMLRERKEHQKHKIQREQSKEKFENSVGLSRYEDSNPYKMNRKPRYPKYE